MHPSIFGKNFCTDDRAELLTDDCQSYLVNHEKYPILSSYIYLKIQAYPGIHWDCVPEHTVDTQNWILGVPF